MKERPILFSAPMVRALLAGTKTQTRRLCKAAELHALSAVVEVPDPLERGQVYNGSHFGNEEGGVRFACPYGGVGDRLWVREAFAEEYDYCDHPEMPGAPTEHFHLGWRYRADGEPKRDELEGFLSGWKPSIHMPRRVSRITLEVTEVRVERLQDISEAHSRAEGITDGGCTNCGEPEPCGCAAPAPSARDAYCHLCGQINGPDSWASNPWVWAVSFKKVTP